MTIDDSGLRVRDPMTGAVEDYPLGLEEDREQHYKRVDRTNERSRHD